MPSALDPLSPDELRLCSAAVKAYFSNGQLVRFNTVQTLEPPKRGWVEAAAAVADGGGGARQRQQRAARAVVAVGREFFELDLLLFHTVTTTARIAACRPIDLTKGQPLATAEDCLLAERVARQDPRVAAACARALSACSSSDYGSSVSPADLMERYVALDPWALHHCPKEWYEVAAADQASSRSGGSGSSGAVPRRAMQVFAYEKPSPLHNEYARPLPVTAAVDLHEQRVIAVEQWLWERPEKDRRRPEGAAAESASAGEFAPSLLPHPPRPTPPKPLRTSQPQGPSFSILKDDPWRVQWQGWDFRVGFNAREGLVLYDVSFAPRGGGGDNSTPAHPIAHRLSIAEMCVPYSDPRPPYNRRCALDAGDYGLGAAAVPQSACADCAGGGDVRYWSPCLSDAQGEPRSVENAVCLHEVDAGVLWKHADYRTGSGPVRRARELVIGFATVAVNYDYLFSWVLGLDGSIRLEVRLTGVLSTNRLTRAEAMAGGGGDGKNANEPDGLPTHGALVAPRVVAGHHQHLFCARLDLSVGDKSGGKGLVVSEVDPLPAAAAAAAISSSNENAGNGFSFAEKTLPARGTPGRDPSIGRVWRVSDPRRLHPRSRKARGYELRLSSPATMLASADSSAARRALFATKSLWVTPHEDGELFPTGKYAMNSREDTGPMARWCGGRTANANNAADDDPVLWVTFGVTHEVRVEDYPVMPRDVCSIELRPYNFFDAGNPAVDLPPPNAADGALVVVVAAGEAAAAPRSRL
jgi:primary-amine oxidase